MTNVVVVGIVDFGDAGEDALALIERGDGGDAGDADQLADALIIAEEEEAIMQDGAAEGRAIEIAPVFRLGAGGREIIACVQIFVAEVFEEAAVKGVRPGASGHVHDAAVEASELGRHVVGFDGEFLDVVEDGKVGDLAGFGLQCGDAVEQIFIGARTASVDAGQERAGRQFDAGSERG